MGILKNVVKNAVNDGIRKGVGNAVGKAVEQAVKPAADRWADKQAKAIDAAAGEMGKTIKDTSAAASSAAAGVGASAAEAKAAMGGLGGFAALEGSLAGFASRAENLATQMSATMKICPSCGQASQGDKTFCPHCGAKLPETTLGQDYTCTQCGTANTPGTKFCSKCGAILPGAEAEIKAQQAKDAEVLAKVEATLPQYPKWTVGGSEFSFDDYGTENGYPVYRLYLAGGRKELDAYINLLLQAGFTKEYDEYWKTVDGVCRAFSANDAVSEDGLNVAFYVGKFDKKPEPKPADNPLGDLKGAAKGLFKKYIGR